MARSEYGDYYASEGVVFKGPLLVHGAAAQAALARRTGWTRARVVRRAVRAFLFYLAGHPDTSVVADPARGALPSRSGCYDTLIEAEAAEAADHVAKRFGVRRCVLVSAALDWYARRLPQDSPTRVGSLGRVARTGSAEASGCR